MPNNFKKPQAPIPNTQSRVQQNGNYLASVAHPSNGAAQFKVPFTPRLKARPAKQVKQGRNRSTPEMPPSNGASQFKTPTTSFPNVSTMPLPSIPLTSVDPRFQEQVKYYADWLAKQAKYDVLRDDSEVNDYIQEATRIVKVGEKEVAIFAPFRPKLSALQTFTTSQISVLCAIGLVWAIALLCFQQEMLIIAVAVITLVYFSNLVLNIFMAIMAFQYSPEEQIDDVVVHALKHANWPMYTILCPLYHEAEVVPQFVQAMLALDYPAEKLQILFLTEADDVETRQAIRALSLPPHFKIVTVPDGRPRTKARACNYGLMQATGTYVVIYDAEDIPDPLQLKKAVLAFSKHGPEAACVQAKLNFYNIQQNILTRWFTAEYSVWFDLILPGLQRAKFSLPLGGTSNHFRTAVLRALGGWDAYNVTEDCDMGLRLAHYHFKTIVLNSTTLEEANSQVKNWIRQRSRWIKGYMQTYLVHMRQPLKDLQQGRFYDLLSLQIVVGSGTCMLFLNPLMWIMLIIYLAFQPWISGIYQILFPTPILYIGVFCLIFGNFFYIYLYILACLKRKHYSLMKWALLIPCYWGLISIAGMLALFELLVKPHYWQKTIHGLHLKSKYSGPEVTWKKENFPLAEEQTIRMPVVSPGISEVDDVPSVTTTLQIISTLPMPAFTYTRFTILHRLRRVCDPWFIITLIAAAIISISAGYYFFLQRDILLYNDAYAHLRVARSIFDSATPGVAQLGATWLPLPHLLMLPFIWNDYLWHTGLAGSIPSMCCYLVTASYLFLTAHRITHDSRASFVGALAFIVNPNVIYLQATPLGEIMCMASLTMACYYTLVWIEENSLKHLILAAACTFLATLVRYDGWALFPSLLVLVALTGWIRRQSWSQITSNLLAFGTLGGLGIGLWLLWGKAIFNDPLYFIHSPYSSQAKQGEFFQLHEFYTYHNLWQSCRFYLIASVETLGPIFFALAMVGAIAFVVRRKYSPDMLIVLAWLVPFGFYALSFYMGSVPILVPEAVPANSVDHLFNVRYAVQMVAPAALFLAILANRCSKVPLFRYWSAGYMVLMLAIGLQALLTISTGIVSLQDGQYGLSCAPQHQISVYLAQHYDEGRILDDTVATNTSFEDAGIDFGNVIYEGSGQLWEKALSNPSSVVDWVVIQQGDIVSQHINVQSPAFLARFAFVIQESTGMRLYHRRGAAPLPTRPMPDGLLTEHQFCSAGGDY